MNAQIEGGCHCGDVRFAVLPGPGVTPGRGVACNCSICTKKGFLHWIVPAASFRVLCGAPQLTAYTFHTHTARHLFCPRCGVQAFYRPRSHPDGWSVNVRCLDDVDLTTWTFVPFDGRDWEAAIDHLHEVVG